MSALSRIQQGRLRKCIRFKLRSQKCQCSNRAAKENGATFAPNSSRDPAAARRLNTLTGMWLTQIKPRLLSATNIPFNDNPWVERISDAARA